MGSAEFCRIQTVRAEDGCPEPPFSKNVRTGHQLSPLPHFSNLTSEPGACNTDRGGPGGRIDETHTQKQKIQTTKTGKPTVVLKFLLPPTSMGKRNRFRSAKQTPSWRRHTTSLLKLAAEVRVGRDPRIHTHTLARALERSATQATAGWHLRLCQTPILLCIYKPAPGRPRAHRKAASLVPIHMYTCALRSSRVGPAGS